MTLQGHRNKKIKLWNVRSALYYASWQIHDIAKKENNKFLTRYFTNMSSETKSEM